MVGWGNLVNKKKYRAPELKVYYHSSASRVKGMTRLWNLEWEFYGCLTRDFDGEVKPTSWGLEAKEGTRKHPDLAPFLCFLPVPHNAEHTGSLRDRQSVETVPKEQPPGAHRRVWRKWELSLKSQRSNTQPIRLPLTAWSVLSNLWKL